MMRSIACVLVLLSTFRGLAQRGEEVSPVDLVSPNIGGIGQLLSATIPYVQLPHGLARVAPITSPAIRDRYLADKI